jgi:hypothetical protein
MKTLLYMNLIQLSPYPIISTENISSREGDDYVEIILYWFNFIK